MKLIQFLILGFLIIPFIEIYVLLEVGSIIGAFPTIFLVVFTAVLGAWLMRRQGFSTWKRFQTNLQRGEIPAYEMIEGPILLVGGALLLTPGFFTDLLGFACLYPPLRRKIAQYVLENFIIKAQAGSVFEQQTQFKGEVLEGEYHKNDESKQ